MRCSLKALNVFLAVLFRLSVSLSAVGFCWLLSWPLSLITACSNRAPLFSDCHPASLSVSSYRTRVTFLRASEHYWEVLTLSQPGLFGPLSSASLLLEESLQSFLIAPLAQLLECSVHTLNLASSILRHLCFLSLEAFMLWVEAIKLVLLRLSSPLSNCFFTPIHFSSTIVSLL